MPAGRRAPAGRDRGPGSRPTPRWCWTTGRGRGYGPRDRRASEPGGPAPVPGPGARRLAPVRLIEPVPRRHRWWSRPAGRPARSSFARGMLTRADGRSSREEHRMRARVPGVPSIDGPTPIVHSTTVPSSVDVRGATRPPRRERRAKRSTGTPSAAPPRNPGRAPRVEPRPATPVRRVRPPRTLPPR
ncbi:hypothetical protein FTX61_12680 [Nitriliruptoraceae bacterium ZYF776]|nr:hypothetical protein [Profundirhabdus halotolerans]